MERALVAVSRFVERDKGQDLLEYGLLVAVVALGMVAALTVFQAAITSAWTTISTSLSN